MSSCLLHIAPETEQLKNRITLIVNIMRLDYKYLPKRLKALFNTKFSDLICDLFIEQASSS